MDLLTSFFGRNGFLPHGYCFTWSPGLLWSMVGADALIAIAYFSIPLAMIHFIRQRDVGSHRWVAWLFCGFISACGLTHLMDIWTIWQPDYAAQMITKVLTAAISVVTAVGLWFLIPKALKIPTVAQLQSLVASLETEVKRRKSAEAHLLDIEQSLAVTLDSIGAGFIATDEQGHVTRMNAVAERITGWPEDEARGQLMWKVFCEEGRPAEVEASNPVEEMIRQCVTVNTTLRVVALARDGTATALELQAAPMRRDDGTVCGLAMVLRDLTQQNRAEAELHRLAAIVESSSDAIIGKTLDGRIVTWNHAAQVLFGYTPEEAIGRSVQMLIPPDRVAEEMGILSNLAHGKSVAPFDTVRRTKDGRDIEVSIAISPIRDEMGRIIGGSKIARDISQQRQAEETRLKAERLETENRQIQEANRLKSQFLANMSHELRTPLNAIIGFADLMHAGAVPVSSPKHREFLGHIGNSGRHLLQLINDVLDLSKIESGKFEFYPEPVDLHTLVNEVCSVMHTSLQR
ncbi:PAS domain S-box protein, partial [Aquabacterium sp.]|uniref:PAS domain S-box protein n=1 Tax=Aquabacterium sp. TaxID=1872578 RepID=UPI002E307091